MIRQAAAALTAVVLLGGLTACAKEAPSAVALTTQRLAAARKLIPTGYEDERHGLAYRWDDRACVSTGSRCLLAHLYAYDTCADGYLEGELLDRKGRFVGLVNGTVHIAKAGGRDVVPVEWTSRRAVSVHITDLECR